MFVCEHVNVGLHVLTCLFGRACLKAHMLFAQIHGIGRLMRLTLKTMCVMARFHEHDPLQPLMVSNICSCALAVVL